VKDLPIEQEEMTEMGIVEFCLLDEGARKSSKGGSRHIHPAAIIATPS
jgi:hypothetical protein